MYAFVITFLRSNRRLTLGRVLLVRIYTYTSNLYFPCYLGDVLVLCDAFEEFRDICMKPPTHSVDPHTIFDVKPKLMMVEEGNYELDPAHYVSAPQLSWDAMLKQTKCRLELITDPEMYRMLVNSMRGGICMISGRYSKANNKYMGTLFDPTKPTIFIINLDANNLYGKAMSYPMPQSGFTWLTPEQWQSIDWVSQMVDQSTGYFVECDLEYPAELHESHNDYPLAPERVAVTPTVLSDKQVEVAREYSRGLSQKDVKLLPSLLDKENYVCHYLNLKFYLEHGMKLKKIHRVIRFQQSRWLEPYISKNTKLRAAANSEMEKEFYKLMNNSIYGKTCENQSKRSDIKLVNDPNEFKKLACKPHCQDVRIFNEQLVGVNMKKVKVMINKPFYVGFAVLELSKLHMYQYVFNASDTLLP